MERGKGGQGISSGTPVPLYLLFYRLGCLTLPSQYLTIQASPQVLTPKNLSWLLANFSITQYDVDAAPLR